MGLMAWKLSCFKCLADFICSCFQLHLRHVYVHSILDWSSFTLVGNVFCLACIADWFFVLHFKCWPLTALTCLCFALCPHSILSSALSPCASLSLTCTNLCGNLHQHYLGSFCTDRCMHLFVSIHRVYSSILATFTSCLLFIMLGLYLLLNVLHGWHYRHALQCWIMSCVNGHYLASWLV